MNDLELLILLKKISLMLANGRRQDSNESLGEGNETTSHQSNHLSRTNESKHDKHSYEEGKVPDHQHVPEQTTSTQQHQMHQPQSNQHQQPHNNVAYISQSTTIQSVIFKPSTTTTSQFSDHAKEVTEESKGFFRSAFASPDQVLKANKHLVLNCYFL